VTNVDLRRNLPADKPEPDQYTVSDSTTPVIVSAVRTPIGRYLGGLSSFTAPQLGAMVIRDAVSRAGIDASAVEEVIMGQVVQGGTGQAPARQALIHAGLPASIPALTINKVCGSGLKAVMLASQAIKAGDAECIVAGGQEAMSSAPHYVYGMRAGIKAGNQTMVDGMIHDGLWDSFGCCHMGEYAEYTAEKAGVSRTDQDAFAYDSHRKAVAATDAGKFKAEILPVQAPGKAGPTTVSADESPRRDTTAETLAKLKPAFRKDAGTVTAGNAPGLNDGASALVVTSLAFARAHGLKPLARVTAYSTGGGEPREIFFAPVLAVRALMEKAGTRISDYDLIEANEAFAVQAIADGRELGWDWDRVNVHGGAVALGHPIGASGARVLTTLLYALQDRGGSTGLATLCLGGGNAVALSVERM
jgi:acetyl-CoA C-acetyltransferase